MSAGLWVSRERLEQIASQFQEELRRGLGEPGSMIKALPTFITKLPTGKERGAFLVVDLGGSNLRVGRVLLHGDSTFSLDRTKWTLTPEIRDLDGPGLFDFIAACVKEYLEKGAMRKQDTDWLEGQIKLGFAFSYPVRQEGLAHGVLIQWNKALNCHDVVGRDVVAMLEEALGRAGLSNVKVGALLNDTVGTLVAHSYVDADTRIGVILGTGTNAAYAESMANIGKLDASRMQDEDPECMVINVEWGAFGDRRPEYLPLTRADHQIDAESINPGLQRFEKMISGMYLGEVSRLCFMDAYPGVVGKECRPFDLDAADLSKLATGSVTDVQTIVRTKLFMSTADKALVEALCDMSHRVVQRSARLCAAALVALYRSLGRPRGRVVAAFDGSLYEHYPGYPDMLLQAVDELEPGHSLVPQIAKDESIVGAAAVLAAR